MLVDCPKQSTPLLNTNYLLSVAQLRPGAQAYVWQSVGCFLDTRPFACWLFFKCMTGKEVAFTTLICILVEGPWFISWILLLHTTEWRMVRISPSICFPCEAAWKETLQSRGQEGHGGVFKKVDVICVNWAKHCTSVSRTSDRILVSRISSPALLTAVAPGPHQIESRGSLERPCWRMPPPMI